MAFSVEQYHLASRDYRSHWRLADEQLYALCRQFPGHDRPDAVLAKLMIIGRAYATGLERGLGGAGALSRAAAHIARRAEETDAILAELDGLSEPLHPTALNAALRAQARLVTLLRGASVQHRGLHSFATKYLHFHRPVVPILDRLAEEGLKRLYRGQRVDSPIDPDPEFDPVYVQFLKRWWKAYTHAVALVGPEHVSVKIIDYYLLVVAGYSTPAPEEPPAPVAES